MLLYPGDFWISGNTPSSKNSKVWTGKMLISSKAVTKWLQQTEMEFQMQSPLFVEALSNLVPPYNIEFTFYRKSKHNFDYYNVSQIVTDTMKSHGWIEDDNANIIKPYYADYVYSKNKPGVLIRILTNKPNHNYERNQNQ